MNKPTNIDFSTSTKEGRLLDGGITKKRHIETTLIKPTNIMFNALKKDMHGAPTNIGLHKRQEFQLIEHLRISYCFTTAAVITKASNVVPIIFGVSAAVGAAAGIASTGLHIAQHIQLQDQIKDQMELVQLQKELSRRQLA